MIIVATASSLLLGNKPTGSNIVAVDMEFMLASFNVSVAVASSLNSM